MNRSQLLERRQALLQQIEAGKINVQRLIGALAMIDQLLSEMIEEGEE